MSEEYLDIIDEFGKLTGERELRSICHEKGLWHQTVHIFLIRRTSSGVEFLAHLRSKEKSSNPNKWAMQFGGHVESGDSIEVTVAKEMFEEVGLTIPFTQLILAGTYSHSGDTNKEFIHSFFCEFNGDESELKFNDGEVQAVRWINPGDILNEIESNPEKWANSKKSFQSAMDKLEKYFLK